MVALNQAKVKPFIRDWQRNMLSQRNIISVRGDTNQKGPAQGDVMSPLLWNLVVNSILNGLANRGLKAVT